MSSLESSLISKLLDSESSSAVVMQDNSTELKVKSNTKSALKSLLY